MTRRRRKSARDSGNGATRRTSRYGAQFTDGQPTTITVHNGGSGRMVSRLTATDRDLPSFVARYSAPVPSARSRPVMKVAVAGGDVRIGWSE
jgi:hypothetical protein